MPIVHLRRYIPGTVIQPDVWPGPPAHYLHPRPRHCHDRYEDCFILQNDLVCGAGTELEVPALVLAERLEGTDAPDSAYVVWTIAAGRARVDHPGGTVLLDEFARRIAWYNAETESWSWRTLDDSEAELDSLANWTLDHSRPVDSQFHRVGVTEIVSEYECLPYSLSIETETADGRTLQIAQEVWVTQDVEMTEEIYNTYRHALRLFDEHWSSVPVERPPGILFRTREVRLVSPRVAGETAAMDGATVEDIGYRLVPMSYFMSDGLGLMPAGVEVLPR